MSDDKLNELHAMAYELLANSSNINSRNVRQRMGQVVSGGYDFADTLHNIYLDYGYPGQLEFSNFWNMYRRFGIAKNVVELPVDAGWASPPIINGSDQFNRDLERLDSRINLNIRLKGLDLRQRVGRYAGMFMRVRDGLPPNQPIDGVLNGDTGLMDMMPLYESQLEVVESDSDPLSETYGQPIMLQYSQAEPGSRNEEIRNTINIHASRVVFASEGSDNGWIYGVPALESVYNSLMDLRKIIGASAEGFYRNACQKVIFNLKDGASAVTYKDKLDSFSSEYDDYIRNGFRRTMWTPGMEVNQLQSSMAPPEEAFRIALNDVASGSQVPATILIGQQTGRLASNEDSRHFLSVVQSRRQNFISGMISGVIDWCIRFGVLPSSEYEIEWDDLLARSDEERLSNAEKMAAINEKLFRSGGALAFSGSEIRESAGFEEEPEDDPGGEDIGEEDEI